MRLFGKRTMALGMAVGLLLGTATTAGADNVKNDVTAGGNDTFVAGGDTTVGYRIEQTGGDSTDTVGRDAMSCNPAVVPVTITVQAPSAVAVDNGAGGNTLRFTSCGVDQPMKFSSETPGTFEITVTNDAADQDDYNNMPAKFTLRVVPRPPSDLSATPGDEQVELDWTLSPDDTGTKIDGYRIYQVGTSSAIDTVSRGVSTYTDTGLTNGTEYCYQISAYKGSGDNLVESAKTSQACATPAGAVASDLIAPTGSVTINDGDQYTTSGSVTLDLQASDTIGVVSYRYANGADCSSASEQSIASTTSFELEITDHALSSGDGTRTVCASYSDSAGNTSETATDDIVVDTAAPTLGVCPSAGPFVVGSGSQSVGPIEASDPKADGVDVVSGVDATASTLTRTVDASTVGKKTVMFSASDTAGNGPTTKSCDYYVQYNFIGFSSPIDNGSVLNKAKAGQAVPLKWRLLDANNQPVVDLSSVAVTVATLNCPRGTTTDNVEEYAAGSSGLQNLGNGYYQFNWKTPTSYATSCKTMSLNLGEGSSRTALFEFVK